jgi:gas vesicle protein
MGRTVDLNEPELESRVQAIADAIAEAAEEAAERAAEAWKESRPVRREAAKTIERQGREIGKWWRHAWRHDIRPGLRRMWSRRTVALASAGAAVPASRQIIEDAAAELGLRPRHERHWGAFVAGMLIGAVTGALIAILTAPKPGAEVREEIAARARDVAESAGEWIPVSAPPTDGNGGALDAPAATEVEKTES